MYFGTNEIIQIRNYNGQANTVIEKQYGIIDARQVPINA